MSENDRTAVKLPGGKQRRLRTIGIAVLLLGLVAAGLVYWIGAHSGASDDDLMSGNARAESHQMQLLYGKLGLLTMQVSDDLKQPGTQAFLIAAISILSAAGCFYFARLSDDDAETR